MALLFCYGSLLLPKVTTVAFNHRFEPLHSVFIKGYTLILKAHAKNPNYHFMLCKFTGNNEDIVAGFIIELSDELLQRIDKWEGSCYKREKIKSLTRTLEEIECFIYLQN